MKSRQQFLAAMSSLVCFLSDRDTAYAAIPSGASTPRCVPLQSSELRHYLYREFEKICCAILSTAAYRAIIHMLDGRAHESPWPRRSMDSRIAADGPHFAPEAIYLNLANDAGEAVEISAQGWNVRSAKSMYFRASSRSGEPPAPQADGPPLDALLEQLTGFSAAVRRSCNDWMLATQRPTGPYPMLVLKGKPGSGKSTLARLLKLTLDPTPDPLPTLPNTPRRLETYAGENRVLAFDHVTHISRELSATLCTLTKPVILTAPNRTALDPELTSRAIIVELPEIEPERRRTEAEISAAFGSLHAQMLGALCTRTSQSMAHLSQTHVEAPPRQADAATWAAAAQKAGTPKPVAETCLPSAESSLPPSVKLKVSPCKSRKSTSPNNSKPIGRNGGSKPASIEPTPTLPAPDFPSSFPHPT